MVHTDEYAVRLSGISKSFGPVSVLCGITLDVRKGEVLALMGENGAGKSTLMRILAGLLPADQGELLRQGQTAESEQLKKQVAMIHQETQLVPELSVAHNIFLGREPRTGVWLHTKRMNQQAAVLLERLGADIAPTRLIKNLRVAEKQLVEIAKALDKQAEVLILDEPTSALSEQECQRLFERLRQLRAEGVAIVYISHKMEEVFALADKISVLRDGLLVATKPTTAWDEPSLISAMVGRAPGELFPPSERAELSQVALSVHNLRRPGILGPISFDLYQGEVLGVAGLMGSGRTELLRALYGLDAAQVERLMLGGEVVRGLSPYEAVRRGMAYISEDRKQDGLVPELSVRHNISLSTLSDHQRWGLLNEASEERIARAKVAELRIKCHSTEQPIKLLSGGNQQKVLLARALLASPTVLLLDESTRGIDVGAKAELYRLIRALTAAGTAVLLVSSELPELLGLSDRILVLSQGKQTAMLTNSALTQEDVLRHAMPH